MSFLHLPLDSITVSDLKGLVDNAVRESLYIEYKAEVFDKRDPKKRMQFLGSVAGFANSMGGDILVGIDALNGLPVAVTGLDDAVVDDELLRIRQIVGTSIEPHVTIQMRAIQVPGGRSVLIVRVLRSWNAPHGIEENEHFNFFARHAAGRAPMTLPELRRSFLSSGTIAEHARTFRKERIAHLTAPEGPWGYQGSPIAVLHLVPFTSALDPARTDVSQADRSLLSPYRKQGGYIQQAEVRFNLDGALMRQTNVPRWHTQLFRDGAIEFASTEFFGPEIHAPKFLDALDLQGKAVNLLPRFFHLQASLGISPPMTIMLSLVGVGNLCLAKNSSWSSPLLTSHQIDVDLALLSDVVVETFSTNPTVVLKPVFDSLWNAAGEPRCPYYNRPDGSWEIDPTFLDEPE